MSDLEGLYTELSRELDRLRPQSIRRAKGFLRHDYLVPAGYYDQLWDWDGFFIGCHLAARSPEEALHLQGWVLNFVSAVDEEGYVAGCVTTEGPRPLFGRFAMKPFLAQGALLAARRLGESNWIAEIWEPLRRVLEYRERTQRDDARGLYFWDNAMQSGADNNVALTNDDADRGAILAADLCTFQLRELLAMAGLAELLGRAGEAAELRERADALREAMIALLWFEDEASFWNCRRDTLEPLRRVSYSNFIPLVQGVIPLVEGREMIRRYLWNEEHLLSPHGLRTLSIQDPAYSNENTIKPYSNWRGPVWPIACFLYHVALVRYGFREEAATLAKTVGELVLEDIRSCGSMHENYHADTGAPLAPTAEQSPGGVFTGFVGWNLTIQNLLEGALFDRWLLLEVD